LSLSKPSHYCYPSGDFTPDADIVLKGLEFISAATCTPGWVRPGDRANLFYLPRFLDGEKIHDLQFEAEICGFMDIMRRLKSRRDDRDSV